MNARRVAIVTLTALILDAALIYIAYKEKQQFYPTIILLQLLFIIFQLAYGLAKLFFGHFQRVEIDNLLSRYWFAFVDICLIFASFQEELSFSFLFTFTFLMIVKGFHWLLEERVDYMQITPEIPKIFHIRVISLMFFLKTIDLHYVQYLFGKLGHNHQLVYLAIGAEYSVLFLSLISTFVRYVFHTKDSTRSTPWNEKKTYLLITDVGIALLKLLVYLHFLTIIWKFHPLPLFLVRPIYHSLRFLTKSIQGLYLSLRAIQYMNTVFKDATELDFSNSNDKTCIICFEEMQIPVASIENSSTIPSSRNKIKRLPCGHMFHFLCLRDWFLTHQNCPTCRLDVIGQIRSQNRDNQDRRNRPQNAAEPASSAGRGVSSQSASSTRTGVSSQSSGPNNPSNGQNQSVPTYGMVQNEWLRYFQTNLQASFGQNVSSSQPPSIPPPPPPFIMPGLGEYPLCVPIILPGTAFSMGPFTSSMPEPPSHLNGSFLDESALRSSVEARMAALRQVQTLLDAAMLQMNAYISATTYERENENANVKTPETTSKTNPNETIENTYEPSS